jgi:hypothetical protein
MNDRSNTIVNNSGTIAFGPVGAGAAVGAGATVVQGSHPPELLAAMNGGLHDLTASVAELAHTRKLDQRRIEFLTDDLERIKKALAAQTPNEQEFKSAASSLWSKVNMVSDGVQSVSGLATRILHLAKLFGWTIAL